MTISYRHKTIPAGGGRGNHAGCKTLGNNMP